MNQEEMLAAREPIVDECLIQRKKVNIKNEDVEMEQGPCTRIDGKLCSAYMIPAAKWRLGPCVLATHLIQVEDEKKFKLNPIKQSKRR